VTEADYALHALPPALLSYTLAVAMLGVVTVRGTARESRRTISLMLLVVAALVEAYWAYTVPISIPRQKHRGDSPDDIIMVCETILRSSLPLPP
jgi:F0F1-type ATP synthase membrane subunit c/vacuolar-type H+-ATPase subunit K